ncbi:hypothetical protein PHMEG_00023603 [Phytophthora megakarya]|uniref:Uncharacterized protein n=1 Tax=Phytophthora megakarya TaxID=4795 RepID=A0A225VFR6_9STRA|nr:hypothetical protein PHMEG_00023603 [Phytophthora megakarya]
MTMKAPGDEEVEDHHRFGWSEEDLKSMYHHKELRDFVHHVCDCTRNTDQQIRCRHVTDPLAERSWYGRWNFRHGRLSRSVRADEDLGRRSAPDPLPLTTTDVVTNLTVSSHYVSAVEDASDASLEPPRWMSLRPSGAWMLEVRSKIFPYSPTRRSRRDNGSVLTDQVTTLQKFINAAMDR